MHPNYDCYYCRSERYNKDNSKKYRLAIMDTEGKITFGVHIYDSWEEVQKSMDEVRDVYAKSGINHHVGYMEVG